MNHKRQKTLIFRWSLLAMACVAAFWGIWSFFAPVPVVTEILWTDRTTTELPFVLSRWWEVLRAGILTATLVQLVTSPMWYTADSDEIVFGLAFSIALGLVLGLVLGFVFGRATGIVFGLASGLASGLVFGLVFGRATGIVFGLAYGLIIGLVFGLASGLLLGLAYGLIIGLKRLISMQFWGVGWSWIMATRSTKPSNEAVPNEVMTEYDSLCSELAGMEAEKLRTEEAYGKKSARLTELLSEGSESAKAIHLRDRY